MKLNRTPNELDRDARNKENENWQTLEKSTGDAGAALENSKEALDKANNALDQSAGTQEQLDKVIIESGTSDAEVIQARKDFPLLKDRLNEMDEFDAEVVDGFAYVYNMVGNSATKTELEKTNTKVEKVEREKVDQVELEKTRDEFKPYVRDLLGDNTIDLEIKTYDHFSTIHGNPLRLHIQDNGIVRISGRITLTKAIPGTTNQQKLTIGWVEQPKFNMGNKPKYQISPWRHSRGPNGGFDNWIRFSNTTFWNPETPSTYRSLDLSLSYRSDGWIYLEMTPRDFEHMVVGAELYIEANAYWYYFDRGYNYRQIYEKATSLYEENFNFLFAPDIHSVSLDSRVPWGVNLLRRVGLYSDMPIISPGDLIDHDSVIISGANRRNNRNTVKDIVSMLGHNFLWCKGNHDDSSMMSRSSNYVLHDRELRELIIDTHNPKGMIITKKDDKLYYYVDDPVRKVRLVFLNTHESDQGVTNGQVNEATLMKGWMNQGQLEWLANEALNFDSKGSDRTNWHTVIFGHLPFNFGTAKGPDSNESVENGNEAWNIIKAFKNGTSVTISPTTRSNPVHSLTGLTKNFATQGKMDLVGYFYGHFHNDQSQVRDGITLISSECFTARKYSSDWAQINRQLFGYDEFIFDVVSINKTSRKVSLMRIGNGEDREFTY